MGKKGANDEKIFNDSADYSVICTIRFLRNNTNDNIGLPNCWKHCSFQY